MAPNLFRCFGSGGNQRNDTAEEEGGPVVVELFTSQGCATSPAAELVLSRLGRGDFQLKVPVLPLAFHVDYWDYVGWKDPFGSSQWTVRQKNYVEVLGLDTLFTPQVVVQGVAHLPGNDDEALVSTINSVPRFPALAFQVIYSTILPFLLLHTP